MAEETKKRKKRASKLSNLDQLDAKDRSSGNPRSLDELVGVSPISPFGTRNKELLLSRLRDMNLSDLQAFAKKVKVFPDYDRAKLIRSILKAFCSYESIKEAELQRVDEKNDITALSAEVRKILQEGA